jgi:formate dehydrogenase iron-sulfur subunit
MAVTVAKLIDTTTCIGCKACEAACQEWNDQGLTAGVYDGTYQTLPDLRHDFWNLIKFNEVETPDGGLAWHMAKFQCMHCVEAGCIEACPAPGAIFRHDNGIVDFDHDKCIGCGYCITGCPFDIPRLSKRDSKVYKCTLCSDRVAVGLEPACVKTCPTGAIVFGTKDDMLHHAEGRIADLKNRGFVKAGLYNPQGVQGTHVMYVLQYADKPEMYHGLPKDPGIGPMVSVWKGVLKPIASVAFGAGILGAALHYVTKGPNKVSDETEEEFKDEK